MTATILVVMFAIFSILMILGIEQMRRANDQRDDKK